MHENGYVILSRDKKDARALRIELTSKCKEYFKQRDKREIEFLENIFAGFDAELTQCVCEGLIKLEQNIKAIKLK